MGRACVKNAKGNKYSLIYQGLFEMLIYQGLFWLALMYQGLFELPELPRFI